MKRFVDIEKCDTCQGRFLCVQDCVTSFLEIAEKGNRVFANFKSRGYCIDCGHCNSICPKKAIGPVTNETDFDNDLLKLFSMKRTVRKYNNCNVISKESLEMIIKAGQSAPTEKNRGTVWICLIKEHLNIVFNEALEVLKKHIDTVGPLHPQYKLLNDLYEKRQPVFWGAEYVVVIVGKHEFVVDGAIAAERMQLMAERLGIASGYNGNIKFAINSSDILKNLIGIKNQEEALVCFALGNTDIKYVNPYISDKKKITIL